MLRALRRGLAAGALLACAVALAAGGCSGGSNAAPDASGGQGWTVLLGGAGGSTDGSSTAGGGVGHSTGGDARTAGTAGAGSDSGSQAMAGAQWEQIPGSSFTEPHCFMYQSKPGTLTFPPLMWISCGAGCETADPLQGYSGLPPAGFASSSTYHGTAYTQFFLIFKGSPWNIAVYRVVRLSDGVTVMAFLQRSEPINGNVATCDFGYPKPSALTQAFFGGSTKDSFWFYGFAPQAPDQTWMWPMPPRRSLPPGSGLRTDSAFIFAGHGGVYGMLYPETNSDWTTLESPSDSRYGGGAEGDLAIWPEWTTARIRGWAKDGNGVRTLIQNAPATTCQVEPSPTHLVGVALDDDCAHGYQRGVRIWYAPRVYSQTQSVTLDPVLEHDVAVDPFSQSTWGDYAAFLAWDQKQGAILNMAAHLDVVQLSTGKAWRVDPRPGLSVQQASVTFDDTWLYYGESTVNRANEVDQLRRIRLDKLDTWGKPL